MSDGINVWRFITLAFLSDDIPRTHPLALHIREKEQMGIAITAIKVGNLSTNEVTSLIAEALDMEDDEAAVKPLAAIVHKKTDGNAFFVLMFLRSLFDEGLLQFNFPAFKWMLPSTEDVNAKLATENVASMLVNKLRRLDKDTQRVLKIAACLGSKFSPSVVATVKDRLSTRELRKLSSTVDVDTGPETDNETISSFDITMIELEQEGICEKDERENVWHFGHDRIQSASFSLIPPEKRDAFRGRLGDILLKRLHPEELEASLFEVVSLCNCQIASISHDEDRVMLAKMNLRAGRKVRDHLNFSTDPNSHNICSSNDATFLFSMQ